MLHSHAKVGEFPPAIPAAERDCHIAILELAGAGNFVVFV